MIPKSMFSTSIGDGYRLSDKITRQKTPNQSATLRRLVPDQGRGA